MAKGAPVISALPDDVWHDQTLASKFCIERELGVGGQAVVVAARHLQLDEYVALKFLLPDVARSSAAVARFWREARAAAKIKNEHVVRIIDVCSTEAGLPYIVMEYLEGHNLEQVLLSVGNGQLAVPDALDFVLQASEALAEGHTCGIVHRDLKPANLFCVDRHDGFPRIKVLDFGISKIKPVLGDVERTDRHEVLGSPRYMSPEQIGAPRDVDQRSDIWSLGVILYQSLTGQVPFGGEVIPDLWHKIQSVTPPSPAELRPGLPTGLGVAVMKCLEKDPDGRYANLGEMASALAYFAPSRSRSSIARILRMSSVDFRPVDSTGPILMSEQTLVNGPPSNWWSRWKRHRLVAALSLSTTLVSAVSWVSLVGPRSSVQRAGAIAGGFSSAAGIVSNTSAQQSVPSASSASTSNSAPGTSSALIAPPENPDSSTAPVATAPTRPRRPKPSTTDTSAVVSDLPSPPVTASTSVAPIAPPAPARSASLRDEPAPPPAPTVSSQSGPASSSRPFIIEPIIDREMPIPERRPR